MTGAVVQSAETQRAIRRAWPAVVSIAIYCVAAAIVYRNAGPFDNHRIIGCACGDAAQEVWFLAWPPFALTHAHNLFFTNWMDFPVGVNLGVNTSFPLLGLLAAPLTLTIGPLFSYNALLWLALSGSATSMMFVLRRWTTWWPAAFAGGLLYGFSAYMTGQGSGHVFLTFVPIPPLILLVLDELVVRQTGSPRRYGLLLGGLAAAQYFISPEILVTTFILSAAGVVVLAITHPRQVRARLRHVSIGLAYALAVCGLFLAYPAWITFRGPQHVVGPPDPLSNISLFHGDLAALLFPTGTERFAPSFMRSIGLRLTAGENGLYLGVPLLLVLIGFTVAFRRIRIVSFAAVMFLVSLILTMGSHLSINNHDTGIPLPWDLAVRIPVIQDVLTARFSLYVHLFAAIVLAVGLDALRRSLASRSTRPHAHARVGWKRGAGAAAAILVAVVALAPLIPTPYPAVASPRRLSAVAAARIPKNSTVLFYPFPSSPDIEGMLEQAYAGMRFKIFGGYAFIPGLDGKPGGGAAPMAPSTLEDIFWYAFYGLEPLLPAMNATTADAIRSAIVLNHVGTIVVEPAFSFPLVLQYLTMALGPPEQIGGEVIWFDAQAKARSSRSG